MYYKKYIGFVVPYKSNSTISFILVPCLLSNQASLSI